MQFTDGNKRKRCHDNLLKLRSSEQGARHRLGAAESSRHHSGGGSTWDGEKDRRVVSSTF